MKRPLPGFFPALAFLLAGCSEDSGPSKPSTRCPDQGVVAPGSAARSVHVPKKVTVKGAVSLPGVRLAPWDSVSAFFGGKAVKLAFVLDRRLYLAEWKAPGPATLVDLTVGDEGWSGNAGNPNSPLFSPDGKRLAYGGSLSKPAQSFVLDLGWPGAVAWRIPLDTAGRDAFDPHFIASTDPARYRLTYVTDPGPVAWSDRCSQLGGSTWAVAVGDSTLGAPEATGWPGSFKGGLSRDGRWAGTSYGPSALYDLDAKRTTLLANLAQQCNPSINPFPAGSANTDYLMILGFGGAMKTVAGDITESIHENLWIYGKEDRIVWRGRLPPDPKYQQWQKPEWSTHPAYATAVALHDYQGGAARKGDLYAVRLGDLADADRATLREAAGYLRLADSVLTESSFSHLWVAP